MSALTDRIVGVLNYGSHLGDDHVEVTTEFLRDILADVRTLEKAHDTARLRYNDMQSALHACQVWRDDVYPSDIRQAKREAYEHTQEIVRLAANTNHVVRAIDAAIGALDAEEGDK
jgi:hypothetical protein